jgi:hypothetical protein
MNFRFLVEILHGIVVHPAVHQAAAAISVSSERYLRRYTTVV